MRTRIFLFFLISFISTSLFATHATYLGGDVTWQCLGNGQYKFIITTFETCEGLTGAGVPQSLTLSSNSNLSSIVCNLVNSADVTPICKDSSAIGCSGAVVEVYRFEYESAPVTLVGVPPATGWYFALVRYARPTTTNLNGTGGQGFRAVMYASPGQNWANPCLDSSPSFLKVPHIYVASNTDQVISFADMSDTDGDSVYAEWAPAFINSGSTVSHVSYKANYSSASPLPSNAINPSNVNGILDGNSGNYQFNSQTTGLFTTSCKLSSYRNGVLNAVVFRELIMTIAPSPASPGNCSSYNNSVPEIEALNLGDGTFSAQTNVYNDTTFYNLDVFPGDSVSVKFSAVDVDFNSDCTPQTLEFTGSGAALSLDSFYNDPLNSAIVGSAATITPFGQPSFISFSAGSVELKWYVEKAHIPTPGSVSYQFNMRFQDNHCPVPGVSEIALKVNILRNLKVDTDSAVICNGDSVKVKVEGNGPFTWTPNTDVVSAGNGEFWLKPTNNTTYSVGDASGYSESVYVQVDNISAPSIGVSGTELTLTNVNNYDSLYWTLNHAPIASSFNGNDKITPVLSGTYQLIAIKGACIAASNTVDTNFSSNFSLNNYWKGHLDTLEADNRSFGINLTNTTGGILIIDDVTVAVDHNNVQNLNGRLRVMDAYLNLIVNINTVQATAENQVKFIGQIKLEQGESYFMSFYFGDSLNPFMYQPQNWPVVSYNNYVAIHNASKGDGNIVLPTENATYFPFVHFNFNGTIDVEENELNQMMIYPNPAREVINLPALGNYQVFDTAGKLLITVKNVKKIDVEDLAPGVYILRRENGTALKFIKE